MQFTIPAELFLRLAGVALQPDETDARAWLRGVRIEHKNGHLIALASCGWIIAGEFISDVDEPDGSVVVTILPAMLEFARVAAALGENLNVAQAPGWTVVTSDSGAMFPANGEINGDGWPDWRAVIPADLPTKNNGVFSFTGTQMARLCASAPSGSIRCAKNIDMTQPTIVRDTRDENWFGVFMVDDVAGKDKGQSFKPATIPEWLRS